MAPVQSPTVNSPIVTPEAPPAPTLDMDSLFANGPYSTSPKTHKIAIVMRVQALLKESGLYDQTPDGAPGPNTQAALRRWQEQHGKVTGRLDSQTLEKMGLENIPQRILPRPNAPSSIPPSSKGSNREITVDEFMRRAKALEGN